MLKNVAILLSIWCFVALFTVGCGNTQSKPIPETQLTNSYSVQDSGGFVIARAHKWKDPETGRSYIVFEGRSKDYPICAIELKTEVAK